MRFPTPLTPIIISKLISSGGGGSVTPGTLIIVSGEMTDEQATQFRENIGANQSNFIFQTFFLNVLTNRK